MEGTITIQVGKSSHEVPVANIGAFSGDYPKETGEALIELVRQVALEESARRAALGQDGLTGAQRDALADLCERFRVRFNPRAYWPVCNTDGTVEGWTGPIYVGCEPDGRIH